MAAMVIVDPDGQARKKKKEEESVCLCVEAL